MDRQNLAPDDALVIAIRGLVASEIKKALAAADDRTEWLDQHSSPLGKRKHLQLCRDGELKARAVGKLRLVRREDLDTYLDAHPQRVREPELVATTPAGDMVAEMRSAARRGRR